MLTRLEILDLIHQALQEDIGPGDITTESTIPYDLQAQATIIAKEQGILAGLEIARLVFSELDHAIAFKARQLDGDVVKTGTVIAELQGPARPLLTGERVALNFLQHLSGIATATRKLVELVKDYSVKVVDTRKTIPGLRSLEKYAVRVGGGYNHRFGLYDAVLIKDNHIIMAGGIKQAVARARGQAPHTMTVEVEVENLEQLEEALIAGADIIMLDNMDVETMREAVQRVRSRSQSGKRVLVEASGRIREATVVEIAQTGVDLISVGYVTHSAPALDISMDIKS